MKRIYLLLAITLHALWASAQYSGSGNGTESDPYLIYNETQLYQMNNFLGSGNAGVVFKLMKDLNLSSFISDNFPSEGWMPVGVESTPFQGKFYGNNHKISGLWINRTTTNNVGLLGYTSGATIQDLTLESTYVYGAANVGTLVGYATGSTFSNCTVTGTGSTTVQGSYVGGVAGKIVGTSSMTDCSFVGVTVKSTVTNSFAGGFVGHAESSTLNNCDATTALSAQNFCGGIAGQATAMALSNCDAKGNISATGHTGGVCGRISQTSTLTNCKHEGDITGNTYVAGVAGSLLSGSSVTFTNSHSKGKILNSGDYTGGVVGISNGACIAGMESCSHFGDISGKNYVGGLVGAITGSIEARPVYYGSTSSTSNTKDWGPSTSTVQSGNVATKLINNCTSVGNITGSSNIGGLIGSDKMSVTYTAPTDYKYSYNSGTVGIYSDLYLWRNNTYVNTKCYYFSPIDKKNLVQTSFQNSYYSGIINGTSNVGGIAGYKEGGTIQYCYTNSSIYGNSNVGGIVGEAFGHNSEVSTQNAYLILKSNVANNTTISATVDGIGRIYGTKTNDYITIGALASAEGNRALTTTKVIKQGVVQEVIDNFQNGNVMGKSLLKLKANYVALGWNFDANWDILETECFPYKKYQAAPPVIESQLVSQDTEISGSSLNGGTVYLYYKDRDAVSTECNGNAWIFATDKLQSGAAVQLYADVEGMTPSYLTSSTVGYPGSGTEEDPYRIYTAEDLQGASNKGYYKLMNDIDLTTWINENSPSKGWVSIGRNSGEATYINGDGHKVTGLWINTTEDYTGLFSNFSAGVIKNLTVEVASGKKVKGGDYTGVLIGRNANGQLLNCTVKGDVEGTKHVGGVAGYSGYNTVNTVSYEGKVTSSTASAYVGGFAGLSESDDITAVHTFPTINATGNNAYVGGVIGYMNGGAITKSHSECAITATGSDCSVAGLVGYSKGAVSQSYTTGTVTSSGTGESSFTAGIVGYSTSPISNCYSTATISGKYYVAGICAYTMSSIDKCYAKGDVYGSRYGGGVVAQLDGAGASLTNSIAACNKLELTDQSSWGSRVIGGFKNGSAEPNTSNYALSTMQVSLNGVAQVKTDDAVEGIAKPAADLMSAETYIGIAWDYSTVWGIDEGAIYPYLLWEVDVKPVTEITLDNNSLIIAQGNTASIVASVMPLGATNKRLEWTSSNTAVATVEDGVVTAKGIGTANITASATDGSNIKAVCKVTVVANRADAIAELQSLVDETQKLYDESSEGDNIGQYEAGARAALLSAIRSVKARINSTMDDETIAACTNDINNAVQVFKSKQVTAGNDTDIAAYENIIYIESAEAAAGMQATLSLKMNNVIAPTGFQCDVYLPEGITVAEDEDGFYLIDLSLARTTTKKTDYFNTAVQADGSVRIMCSSTKSYTFDGNEGEVATIKLNISEDIEEGTYPLILKNVIISDASASGAKVDYVKTTLTVSTYTLGDANADGDINVMDFTAIANHIMGNTIPSFVAKAADVNMDNEINVMDLTGEANLILYGAVVPHRAAMKVRSSAESSSAISAEDYAVKAGREVTVDINLSGDYAFSGFQFDMILPEGLKVKSIDGMPCVEMGEERTNAKRTDYFTQRTMADGSLRILCASTRGYAFEGTEGSVARVTLVADADLADAEYEVALTNAILSANGEGMKLDDASFNIYVGDATAIEGLGTDASSKIYDLTGKYIGSTDQLKSLKKGLYIINGKKLKK